MAAMPKSQQKAQAAALFTAIENGTSDEKILAMIERNPDLVKCLRWKFWAFDSLRFMKDWGGVLHCSAYYCRDSLVNSLLRRYPIDVNQRTREYEESALHHASRSNATRVIELLLKEGVDINCKSKCGESALHHASGNNAASVVELLLKEGANIHFADNRGWSALHHASWDNATNVVEQLLQAGADIHCKDNDGESALHLVSKRNATRMVDILLDKGANIHCVDNAGKSALQHASEKGHLGVVMLLLNKGANIDCVDKAGESALHCASEKGHIDVVKLLLEKGANIDCVDKGGKSALHYASRGNATGVVELLLDKGADIHCVDYDGNTPLHSAAAQRTRMLDEDRDGFPLLAKTLGEFGVNPLAKNKEEKTAREVVVKGDEYKHWILRVIEANYLLRGVAKAKAKRVRVSVLGDAAVGKSELVSTLSSPDAKGRPSTPPQEGSEEYYAQRTPGIAITELTSNELEAILHFMDYAGQPEFLAGHSPLMVTSYGLYLLVLHLLHGREHMLQSARKWLRFIVSKRDPSLVADSTPPRLYAVFSHADKLSSYESSALANRVYRSMKQEFRKFFTWMEGKPFVVNCQESSQEMDRLLKALISGHLEVTKEMPCEPVINDKIRQAIEDRKGEVRKVQAKTGYHPGLVLSLDQYHTFLKKNVSLEVTERNEAALKGSLELLDLQGDVLVIKAVFDDGHEAVAFHEDQLSMAVERCQATTDGKECPLTTFIVLDPAWFCRDVLKVILSPPEFPCAEIEFPDHGVCAEVDINCALQSVKINPAIGKAFLETSNICGRNVPRDNEFFCPYHLRAEAPAKSWEKDNTNPPQGGILLYCRSSPAAPVLMAHLQLAFCKRSGGVSKHTCIWKKGLVFQWHGFVTIKMEQVDGEHDVSLIARARAGELTQCATALSDVSRIAMATAWVVTPGSDMEVRYLSPAEVGDYAPPSNAYRAEEVIYCSKTQTKLQRGVLMEDPCAILPVLQACRPDLFLDNGPQRLTCSSELHEPTLLAIAELLPKQDDCVQLSQVIGASAATRAKVEGRNPLVRTCSDTFDMLLSWWREQPAHGGHVLHDALREVGRADLADKFKDKLLSRPDVCSERVCVVSPTDFGKVLNDVSLLLADRLHALKVGYELRASALAMAIVQDVEEARYHSGCAKQMLMQWWSEQSGSDVGAQLYRALVQAGRRDIAERFKQQLLEGYREE